MKNNLFARFGLICGVLLMIVGLSYPWKLKGGIDLVGGTDLLYELDLSHFKGTDTQKIAAQVIEVLKKRIDPTGVRNLVWRVVGGNRIEVQMPMADQATRDARKAFQEAQNALRATNIQEFQVTAALLQTGEKRNIALNAIAVPGTPERALIDTLAAAADARDKIDQQAASYPDPTKIPLSILDDRNNAKAAYNDALSAITAHNINVAEVTDLIVTSTTATADTSRAEAAKKLKSILEKPEYAVKKPLLDKLQSTYASLAAHKTGGFDDPEELERLMRGSGVLDFRIAVVRGDRDMLAAIEQAHIDLAKNGPYKPITGFADIRWFEVDPENGASLLVRSSYVLDQWGGKNFILLYTDRARALTHDPDREWNAINPTKGTNEEMQRTVNFKLDQRGQQYFGQLTLVNKGQYMAILLDDKAIQAPTIHEPILTGECQISLGNDPDAAEREADMLVDVFNAGSLPAALQHDPISKKTIGSALGDDNIKAGLRSGIIAVIAVMAFMVVYYTITGFFADVALLINLILLLGCMSMLQATFTLPGIAGIVLTLGMAVDANVLINERIREELHKGASLWNAVRQGYDKVFWTIFDANTTTSLTSIVLYYVGSEEVKGFGVTLLIGLMIHMFTALFVTRTLMMASIRWGVFKAIDDLSLAEYFRDIFTFTWIRGRWPFMRVFHLSNFDWIGKRHFFWGVSAVITIGGLIAFVIRDHDKSAYDTEFNGGTAISFTLNSAGVNMTDSQVRAMVAEIPNNPKLTPVQKEKLAELKQANVYSIKAENSSANQFEIVTTITDRPDDKTIVALLQDQLLAKFHKVLTTVQPVNFKDRGTDPKNIRDLIEQKRVIPITAPKIPADLVGATNDMDVPAYQGGVAIVLDMGNNDVPITLESLKTRISDTRHADDQKATVDRSSDIIPITYALGTDPAKGIVTKALLVVADPNISYDKDQLQWQSSLATSEWSLVNAALSKASGFDSITSFDPQVATEAKARAVIAVGLSLILIVIYVWIRFGGIRYGLGAIFSLVHDAIVAIAATVLAGVFRHYFPKTADALLIGDFKINLTMIAAYLTVIGYSVNDTIVIFDRIRENRGRAHLPMNAKLINDSINQCFGRTIWTTFTVFIVVLIMYIWGGEGVRGFSFAMLIGVFTGAYSTLAIASPMLLNVVEKAPTGKPSEPGKSIAVIPEVTMRRSGLASQ